MEAAILQRFYRDLQSPRTTELDLYETHDLTGIDHESA
jgi:hypothetical protein